MSDMLSTTMESLVIGFQVNVYWYPENNQIALPFHAVLIPVTSLYGDRGPQPTVTLLGPLNLSSVKPF